MSLSARERQDPPPRRKSCAACIKSKRRCDFAMPSCFRCSQRGMPCVYPARVLQRRGMAVVASASTPVAAPAPPAGVPSPAVSYSPPSHHHAFGAFSSDALLVESCSGAGFIDPVTALQSLHMEKDANTPMTTTAYEEVAEEAIPSGAIDFGFPWSNLYNTSEAVGLSMELSRQPSMLLSAPVSKELDYMSEVVASRLRYSIDVIKKSPSMMVLEMQTPWTHHLLYADAMPRYVEDAVASCAMYMAKNRVNSPVILRSIESRVTELLNSNPVSAEDNLAYTHALLLYQIMRMFDGDIRARASAERCFPAMESAALRLLTFAKFDSDFESASTAGTVGASTAATAATATAAAATNVPPELPIYPIGPTKAFWRDWIFQESARRTLLITLNFLQMCRALSGHRNLHCDGKLGICSSLTVSAHLWRARTAAEFAMAWNGREHYVVRNADFGAVLRSARAPDIDLFGRMFITTLLGREEAEGWFVSVGGSLLDDVF